MALKLASNDRAHCVTGTAASKEGHISVVLEKHGGILTIGAPPHHENIMLTDTQLCALYRKLSVLYIKLVERNGK